MSQHWKSLLVVLVIIGAIVFFYRGDKGKMQAELTPAEPSVVIATPEAVETTVAPIAPAAPVTAHAEPEAHATTAPASEAAPAQAVETTEAAK